MASPPHVRLRQVSKHFNGKTVLSGLDLEVRRGEVITLLGASGSGKSILLKALIGLVEIDSGQIEIDGKDVTGLSEEERRPLRRSVSMLFQSGALLDSLTVADNIAYPLRVSNRFPESEIRERVQERLAVVGLPGIEDLWPSELSGGMRKRVALARALVGDPEIILYDEPTTGLDPPNTRRINELILHVRGRGVCETAIVVTHDLASAFMLSDRLAMLHEGRLVADLPPAEFLRSREKAVVEFLSAMPPFPGVRA